MNDITALHRTIAPGASSQFPPCAASAAAAAARARQLQIAKRAAFIVALLACSAGLIALCVRFGPEALAFVSDTERFRTWVEGMGIGGRIAFVAANAAQVVLAFLPGEPLELAAGYAFGTVEGTLWCLVASAIGTGLALLLTRTFGMRVVRLFFPPEKISEVKWLQDARRFELVLFLVFLVPGTPKDLLTYVAGLGTSPAWRIVALTTVGRIPSIVSSTLVAGAVGSGNYTAAAIVAAITVGLAGIGVLAYRHVTRTKTETV